MSTIRCLFVVLGALFALVGCQGADDDDVVGDDDAGEADDDTTGDDDTGEADDDSGALLDADGDGWSVEDGDCDDHDAAVHPGASEICDDHSDNDCDGHAQACRLAGAHDAQSADAVLEGEVPGDGFGHAVAFTGDVDADGYVDLLIGAPNAQGLEVSAGAACLFRGPVTGTVGGGQADAVFLGEADGDGAGESVAAAGDVNADGFDDVLIGARGCDGGGPGAGAAYLFLGPVSGTMGLDSASVEMVGEASGDEAGTSVAGAGDVDGDGFADILIGAESESTVGAEAGAVYLLRGPLTGSVDLSLADAKILAEAPDDLAGSLVLGPGDLDGDGLDDILVGALGYRVDEEVRGAFYLLLSPVSGVIELSSFEAKIIAGPDQQRAGYTAAALDADDDGRLDVLFGAVEEMAPETPVVPSAWGFAGSVSGQHFLSDSAIQIQGDASGCGGSMRLGSPGDLDGDGADDLVTACGVNDLLGGEVSTTYLFYGPVDQATSVNDASATFTTDAVVGSIGRSWPSGSDTDGDGFDDLLFGASWASPNGDHEGAAYLFCGGGM